MRIYAVRHGQTIFNWLDKVQGWADTPLTPKGEADGRAAGQRLKNVHFDAALSSDTSRAIHTAEFVLAENLQTPPALVSTPEWREYFFGSFEGGGNHDMWSAVAAALGLVTDDPSEIAEHADMTTIMGWIRFINWILNISENPITLSRQSPRWFAVEQ